MKKRLPSLLVVVSSIPMLDVGTVRHPRTQFETSILTKSSLTETTSKHPVEGALLTVSYVTVFQSDFNSSPLAPMLHILIGTLATSVYNRNEATFTREPSVAFSMMSRNERPVEREEREERERREREKKEMRERERERVCVCERERIKNNKEE